MFLKIYIWRVYNVLYSNALYSPWFVDLESELSPRDLSRLDLISSSWKIYVTGYNSPPVHKHFLAKAFSKRTFEILVVSDNSTALYNVSQERFAHNLFIFIQLNQAMPENHKSNLSLDGFYNTNGTQDYSTQFNTFHVHSPWVTTHWWFAHRTHRLSSMSTCTRVKCGHVREMPKVSKAGSLKRQRPVSQEVQRRDNSLQHWVAFLYLEHRVTF